MADSAARREAAAAYQRSRARFAQGDHAGALSAAREAIACDPAYPNAENFAGWILMSKPDRTPADLLAAVAHFEKATEGVALANLGDALLALGRGDEAVRRLEPAADRAEARTWLGWYLTAQQPDLPRAIAYLRDATRLRPAWGAAWLNLAKALDASGDAALACHAFGEAVACGDARDDAFARDRRVQLELLLRTRGEQPPAAPDAVRADSAAVGIVLATAAYPELATGHTFMIRPTARVTAGELRFAGIATVVGGRALGHVVVRDTGERRTASVLVREDPLAFAAVEADDPHAAAALLREWLAQGGADPAAVTSLDVGVTLLDRFTRDLSRSWRLSLDAERPATVSVVEIADAAAVRVTACARAGGGVRIALFPQAMAEDGGVLEASTPQQTLEQVPEIVAATRRAIEARDAFAARPLGVRQIAPILAEAVAGVRRGGWHAPAYDDGYPRQWPRATLSHDARPHPVIVVEESARGALIAVGDHAWTIAAPGELPARLGRIAAAARRKLRRLVITKRRAGDHFRVVKPLWSLEPGQIVELADAVYAPESGHTYLLRTNLGTYVALCDSGRTDAEILGRLDHYLEPVS